MPADVLAEAREIIAEGFRARAGKLHPDYGGSHDAMVRTNQANEWLRQVVDAEQGAAA